MSILDNALSLITLLSLFLLGPALGRALVACVPGWQDWPLAIQHLVVGICTMIAVAAMVLAYGELWKFSPTSVAWYNWIQEVPVAGNVNVGDARVPPAPEGEGRAAIRSPEKFENRRPRR
jgi:hypothetical protein